MDNYKLFFIISITIILLTIPILLIVRFQKKSKMKNEEDKKTFKKDEITGLWKMDQFIFHAYNMLFENVNDDHNKYSMISIKISKFRYLIETYGYSFGNEFLKILAKEFIRILPEQAFSARHSSDKFVFLIPHGEVEDIFILLNDLYEELEYINVSNHIIRSAFNSGAYLISQDDHSVKSHKYIYLAIDNAEIARKKVGKDVKNQVMYFEKKMHSEFFQIKAIEDNMEYGLKSGEFTVYYQPKFNINDMSIVGAEALVRWNSKKLGFLYPDDFIPLLERNNYIIELDFYVLEQTYKLINSWMEQGIEPIPISINQSRVHITYDNYFNRLEKLTNKYQIPKELIELEITERVFYDADNAAEFINKLSAMEYRVSMDDFGFGYSSFNLLNKIDLATIKLDKCFISEDADETRSKVILSKVIEMADILDMGIICEGVETVTQEDLLKSVGCNFAQGYLYARPMPKKEFINAVEQEYLLPIKI